MEDDYTPSVHAHRYAAWCAARASGRGLEGSTNAVIRDALEASDLPADLDSPDAWPATSSAFDARHITWCEQVLTHMHARGVVDATFGRAAKVVAIYLKTRVVCGGQHDRPLGQLAHPPIDRVLLQALARDRRFSRAHRALWRQTRWTALDASAYGEIIHSLREENLDEGGFWRVERWWVGDAG